LADGHLLLFAPFLLNFDDFSITFSTVTLPSITFPPVALPCNRHLNLQIGFDLAYKKARKEAV
jgi:hypothetical protein